MPAKQSATATGPPPRPTTPEPASPSAASCNDGGVPVSLLTSASLHDSQAAITSLTLSALTICMSDGRAYDADEIRTYSRDVVGACAWPDTVRWYNVYGSDGDTVYHTIPGLQNGVKYGVALRAHNQSATATGPPPRPTTPEPASPSAAGPRAGACATPAAGVKPPPFVPPASPRAAGRFRAPRRGRRAGAPPRRTRQACSWGAQA